MTAPCDVGVVGAGYWGVNYVRVLSELFGPERVVVCDTSKPRRDEVRSRFPSVRVVASIDDLLENGIGAVVVATPATLHHGITSRLLAADVHALVEKPLTVAPGESEELCRLAEDHGRVLMVGHTFLYNDGIRFVKERVDAGELGPIRYLYARRTNLGPVREDVNALWDLATHDVAVFNHIMGGPPVWVSAVGAQPLGSAREDVGFAVLEYADGTVGHVHASWLDPHKVRELVVVGRDERVVFDDLNGNEPIRIFEKGVTVNEDIDQDFLSSLVVRDGGILSPRVSLGEPLRNQVEAFFDHIGRGTRPVSDGRFGLDVVRVMDAIGQSIQGRGAPIPVSSGSRQEDSR